MVAHGGARSLLVKILDMKMWDASLIKYYISSLFCPLSRTWEFTVNSHSSQHQDFLDPKNSLALREHHDQLEFELASWWGKLESSLFLLLPTTRRQYYHRLHRCHGNFPPIHSGKYIRLVLPHHSGIILITPLGCSNLLRSIDHTQWLSLVLVRTMTATYFCRPTRRV